MTGTGGGGEGAGLGELRRAGGTHASAFERATAVEPLGDGAWHATCDAAWATQLGANGGFLAAIVLRAMIAQLEDPAREARSLTCHYLRRPDNSGAPEAVTGGWLRFADPQPLDAPALAMYADAWLPAPLPLLNGPALAPTVDPTLHFRAPAAAAEIADEPVLAVFRSSTSAGGLFEEDGELWSRDGVLLAQSRQLALLLADPR